MPPDLSADDIERLALANLGKRAQEGKPLSDSDWQRLKAAQSAQRPDPLGEVLAEVTKAHAEAKAAGKGVPAALVKLAREALQREQAAHAWPDAGAAAQELAVSVQTVRNWCDEAGIPHARTSIPRADLYRALWLRERQHTDQGGAAPVSDAESREQELRIVERQARIDERTGRLIAQANDAGRAGVIAAVRDLRQALLGHLPRALADDLAQGDDRLVWEGRAKRIVSTTLETLCAELVRKDNPCQTSIL